MIAATGIVIFFGMHSSIPEIQHTTQSDRMQDYKKLRKSI
jgi:hypothetical protein